MEITLIPFLRGASACVTIERVVILNSVVPVIEVPVDNGHSLCRLLPFPLLPEAALPALVDGANQRRMS